MNLELAEFFGMTPLAWLSLALSYDLIPPGNFVLELSIVTYLMLIGDWYPLASFDEYNKRR